MKLKMYYPAVIEVIGKNVKAVGNSNANYIHIWEGWHNASLNFDIHALCKCFYAKRVVEGGLIQSNLST